jgi:hypothetical protein
MAEPETNDRYPGMTGATHGDKNENSPALNASPQLTAPAASLSSKAPRGIAR